MNRMDIADQLTLRLPVVKPPKKVPALPIRVFDWVRQQERAFWLRLCCMVFIVAVECSGFVLYLSSEHFTFPSLIDSPTPTATQYPCAHVVLAQQGRQLQAMTNYVCP